MVPLKHIKYSAKFVETGGIFFAREEPTSVMEELNSFAICSVVCNDFLLIFSALGKILFFTLFYRLFLSLFSMIPWYFLDILITFLCKNYFSLFY